MYNKYIINRLLLWDSEEPACVGFFSSFSRVPVQKGMSRDFLFTRSTQTPLHYGGRNPSNPRSPCLLSGGWHSVRCLCCLPWSFCAQSLGRMRRGGGDEGKRVEEKQSRRDMSISHCSFTDLLLLTESWFEMFWSWRQDQMCCNGSECDLNQSFYSIRHPERAHSGLTTKIIAILLEISYQEAVLGCFWTRMIIHQIRHLRVFTH